jgi:uncharacterized protein (DUF488 family)
MTTGDMKNKLFTIGHSNRDLPTFVSLLRENGVTVIADVRSQPYSKRYPQFDQQSLKITLRQESIEYVFMGNELGARRSERECYVSGKARYELIAKTYAFQDGITRIKEGAARHCIALMCSERDPLICHRTILICRYLQDEFDLFHIIDSCRSEAHSELESRLFKVTGLPQRDLFSSYGELLEQAYVSQAERIAFVDTHHQSDSQSLAPHD